MPRYEKDPGDVLDYPMDWTRFLKDDAGQLDTITLSAWSVTGGPSLTTSLSSILNPTTTVVWLSGGIAGTTYTVTNRIVTAGGRTAERSITIVVRDL
ncbi:phage fiber-tail adaptor protein [Williamsia deligens]